MDPALDHLASRSLWLDGARESLVARDPLPGDSDTDVAIVGAGFTGLWTALALLERVVACATPERGLVVDLFAGSGTTAVAANRLGRRAITGDASPVAIATARRREVVRFRKAERCEIASSRRPESRHSSPRTKQIGRAHV